MPVFLCSVIFVPVIKPFISYVYFFYIEKVKVYLEKSNLGLPSFHVLFTFQDKWVNLISNWSNNRAACENMLIPNDSILRSTKFKVAAIQPD